MLSQVLLYSNAVATQLITGAQAHAALRTHAMNTTAMPTAAISQQCTCYSSVLPSTYELYMIDG
jgi:hypothetical protein